VRVGRIAGLAHAAFDGEGARRYGSRWTPKGFAAVFTSASLSLAALECFVHTDIDVEPIDLVAIAMEIGDRVAVETVAAGDLPQDWRVYPAPPALALIGRRWLEDAQTAVLSIPSVVIPHERNFILNPAHPDFSTMSMIRPEPFSFDPRMWKKG
jgi:RES domain-containing protein